MLAGSKRNKKGILDPDKGPEQLPFLTQMRKSKTSN